MRKVSVNEAFKCRLGRALTRVWDRTNVLCIRVCVLDIISQYPTLWTEQVRSRQNRTRTQCELLTNICYHFSTQNANRARLVLKKTENRKMLKVFMNLLCSGDVSGLCSLTFNFVSWCVCWNNKNRWMRHLLTYRMIIEL